MCKLSQQWGRWLCTMLLLLGVPFVLTSPYSAAAQSLISGDIAGTVTDPSGAAIQGATITATNTGTGLVKTVQSGGAGEYKIGLLPVGTYTVEIAAPNFQSVQQTVGVSIGQTATVTVALQVAKGATTVEVLGQTVPLLQPENSDISTTLTEEQVQNLPNPGGDITYYIQLTQGVVMNTQMHYGNSSAFGLPATSNNFTVNGAEDNDPFLNLNNSGPSNLLLGSNDVGEVNIVANAYSSQYGALGGVQENITTRSGTNSFHGDAQYYWANSDMEANDWFNDNTGAPKPFANANQWGVGVGGPIKKDKTFFFINYEGLRFVTSPVDATFLPTAAYESNAGGTYGSQTVAGNAAYVVTNPSVLGNDNNCDNNSSFLYFNGNGSECNFYKKAFALYAGAPRASSAAPFGMTGAGPCVATGTIDTTKPNNGLPAGCTDLNPGTAAGDNTYFTSFPVATAYSSYLQEGPKNHLAEVTTTARLDQKFGPNDGAFIHFKYDHGVQPTYVDPIDSVFNAQSDQPDYEGQLEETHTFTPNLVNQFILSGTWYSAYFLSDNTANALAAFPYDLDIVDGSFSNLGNSEDAWPEGRDVTQYQVNDDVSWTHGKHTVAVGMLFKRDDVTDADLGVLTNFPLGAEIGPAEGAFSGGDLFSAGLMLEGVENFPLHLRVPIRTYNLGFYGQDQWKLAPNLQVTAGVRVEHNSNPVCVINCFAYMNGSYNSQADTLDTAYNSILIDGKRDAFTSLQKITIDPRIGFTFSPTGHDHTVIRGGFGLFTDVFPATVADSLLNNAPLNPEFVNLYSLDDPSQSGNFLQALSATNQAFVSGFASGGSANSIAASNSSFTVPNLTNPDANIHYPTYEEWSLQWEQQVGNHTSFTIGYVGNHGYHEPVEDNGVNMYGISGAPSAPTLPEFAEVTEVESVAGSNYHGLLTGVKHESKYLTAAINYSWSHALDEISNGGILPFGFNAINPVNPFNIAQYNYGNADYDIRQNMNGNYILKIPYWGGPKLLTDNWQLGGTIFWHSGFPFSVTDDSEASSLNGVNDFGPVYADITGSTTKHCGKSATTTPCLNSASFSPITGFGDPGYQRRNQFTGPHYFNTDFSVLKGFKIPGTEAGLIQFGAQAYNVLNHTNFAQPVFDSSNPAFGLIQGDVSTPTSVFGAFLGADADPRIIQLKGKIIF
ncbi:MAG TPA: carboxypeptidase regulatory-like domain-containing protein [Acidobacteriaceae bacterium]|nr:carboxypeptidase regulatory-like domain-containing protein [Acidobacteriaceae bacterium]